MTRGEEILQRMIEAAGLENAADIAAMFGVDEMWIRDILPPALEFVAAYCEICEQRPVEILGLQAPAGMTGRHRDREGYFAAVPDRIGVAAGRFEVPDNIDEDNAKVETLFKGLMAENGGKLNFEACDNEFWIDPIVAEVRQIREKLMAECGNDMSKYFERILRLQDEMKAAGQVFVSFEKPPEKPEK